MLLADEISYNVSVRYFYSMNELVNSSNVGEITYGYKISQFKIVDLLTLL